jgi:choline dehydrogenase
MMGRANDSMAVVDSKARVIGVTDLRVIDSSSFRFTPPGHTQAATCELDPTSQYFVQYANHSSDAHAEKLVEDIKNSLGDM